MSSNDDFDTSPLPGLYQGPFNFAVHIGPVSFLFRPHDLVNSYQYPQTYTINDLQYSNLVGKINTFDGEDMRQRKVYMGMDATNLTLICDDSDLRDGLELLSLRNEGTANFYIIDVPTRKYVR